MPEIFGAAGAGLRRRIGSLAQVLRVDSFVEAEGSARGARRLRLVNGSGIEVEVHPDRGLDIGQVTIDGIPMCWISPTGITAPQFYEPAGTGWLRTFGGGLLATCGLDTFGPPSTDAGQALGLHGRIGTRPAQVVRAEATVDGVVVEGIVRQASVFGENLVLHRRISAAAGSDTLVVEDTVTNEGFDDAPHMILYHVNLGWPLLDDEAVLDISSDWVEARDADAEAGLATRNQVGAPVAGFREQVYRHAFPAGRDATARVSNARLGLEFRLQFSSTVLPTLYQWKMVGQGTYALGLEPANSPNIFGRAAARVAGQLPVLASGESTGYRLAFSVRRADPSPASGSAGEFG